jgi:hypothetical protein
MSVVDDVKSALEVAGITTLGIAVPLIAASWTEADPGSIEVGPLSLRLALGTDSWKAPLPVTVSRVEGFSGVTLLDGAGNPITESGMLMTVFPGAWIRLSRLYAQLLETADATRPLRASGRSVRPVPRYFYVAGTLEDTDVSGQLNAGDELSQNGTLTIHDSDGLPIDPLAVAAAFAHILGAHDVLRIPSGGGASQLQTIAELGGASPIIRVRLSDLAGKPAETAHLTGLTVVDGAAGIHSIIGEVAVEAAGGGFTAEARRLIVVGPATTGRLTDRFAPPSLLDGSSLARDFFSLRVLHLDTLLLGTAPASWQALHLQSLPPVRTNEPVTLVATGNDLSAAAEAALTPGGLSESLAVAPLIDGGFDAPDAVGSAANWPDFPPLPGGAVPGEELSAATKASITLAAQRFDDGNVDTATVDVLLTLGGLPAHAAVRIFPRVFNADATESRGDGAGGVTDASGSLTLLLRDPFAMRLPNQPEAGLSIPDGATLRVDAVVVTRGGKARTFGNLSTAIPAGSTPTAPTGGSNAFGTAVRRGVCLSGMLGLGTVRAVAPGAPAADVVLAMLGEGTPRDASRFPSMARRELLAAGRDPGGAWEAALGAGRLAGESLSAQPQRGSPGGSGGREVQLTGIATGNGRLAYDIARAAFRRTTNVVSRVVALHEDTWDEPTAPSAPPPGQPATATAGTFAGVILQTIAPLCETPELAALESQLGSVPSTFSDLVDWLNAQLPAVPLRTQIQTQLNSLKNDDDNGRMYGEITRELASSAFGRRDAMWALKEAIGRARRFIYVESPGIGPTGRSKADADPTTETLPDYTVELLDLLRDRVAATRGLHVILCTPKVPAVGPGYEPLAARELLERRVAILGRQDEAPLEDRPGLEPLAIGRDESRVVAFHPLGFPGREVALESTVVIVDDSWMLIGSSSLRRRGLTFDGGTDAVLTDTEVVDGASPTIQAFRRRLLADRLGVQEDATGDFGFVPDPTFIRLLDGVEAFHAVRERLRAGGLGRIARLYRGNPQFQSPDPGFGVSFASASPDGKAAASQVSVLAELLLISGLAGAGTARP